MTPSRALLTFCALAFLTAGAACAASQEDLLSEANICFDQANEAAANDPEAAEALYDKAILRFERLINEEGIQNGRLEYNLANAYFLKGDLGRAILHYRRAARLIPNDLNLHQNLAQARQKRLDRIEEPQQAKVLKTLFFWHYDLPGKTRMSLFALCYLLLWSMAAGRLRWNKKALNGLIATSLLLSLSLAGSLGVDAAVHARERAGVLLQEETIGRKGNGETYEPSFEEPLHAGTEFNLAEARAGWYHIELADGRKTWIPSSSAELVRPQAAVE